MEMKTASVISTSLHAAVLLWAVVSFTGKTFEVTPAESLPVDLVSEKEFSQMTKGAKDAPKLEVPKPLVEKIAEPKPADTPAPKITEKPEVKATAPKTAEPTPQAKPDPIADKLKKPDDPKQEAKADPQPLPPKKPEKKQPKFDADRIAALLDKRDPTRNAATGDTLNNAPSMGVNTGKASKLTQSEIDALRARLYALWSPPVGAQDADGIKIEIRIRFRRDGTLEIGPQVLTSGSGALYIAMRDTAVRAVLIGQPYTMLRPDHYDDWKEIDFVFDTKQMFHDLPTR
jgi:outer membrane biosynthesis protein TonB